MNSINFGIEYADELKAETAATRKCLERIPEKLFDWKPHEKSMTMGYLALLVAEIPKWISAIIEESVIDFGTFTHFQPQNTAELVNHFNENLKHAVEVLEQTSNEALEEPFYLKYKGKELFSSSKKENVSSSINHMVHHRGQLTVYMRLNDISVPSIYGPSADDTGGFSF